MVEQGTLAGREVSGGLAAVLVDAEPVLVRLAERLCVSDADVCDLVQDTFERATRQGLPAEVRSTRAWLTTIMHRLFVDRCRSAAGGPACLARDDRHGDIIPLEPDAAEPPWGQLTLDDVRDALGELEATYREVYLSHTFERRSYEQIAELLSIERVTVGTRLTRARWKLRDILGRRFGVESDHGCLLR